MTALEGLRVALVHGFYGSAVPSGENQAVLDQAQALSRAGCETAVVSAHTDELSRTLLYPLRAAATVATGRGRSPLGELRRLRPDVVHVHNLFPNFGRSWLRLWDGPLVATVHNYRPLCAAATLYRDGAGCTRCPDGDSWAGLRHGCYRDSRMATLPLSWAGRRGPTADPLLSRADRMVVLSQTSRQIYLDAGLPAQKLDVVPNFVAPAPPVRLPDQGNGPWGFAGRLSPEKGLVELLRRWPPGEPLEVVGDGPQRVDCEAAAPASVRFLGALDRTRLRQRMASWQGLVFPGRCLEGAAPLVCLEALSAGLPVLALSGSSAAFQVLTNGTGAVFGDADPLAEVLTRAAGLFPALRSHCRQVFAEQYSEQAWAERMRLVYRSAQGAQTRQEVNPR